MKKEVILGLGTVAWLGALVVGGGLTEAMSPYLEVSEAVDYMPENPERTIQVVGDVVDGSIARDPSGLKMSFRITDGNRSLKVGYRGVIPDNFQAGQEVVAGGRAGAPDSLSADQLLVKCPTKYEGGDVEAAEIEGI